MSDEFTTNENGYEFTMPKCDVTVSGNKLSGLYGTGK